MYEITLPSSLGNLFWVTEIEQGKSHYSMMEFMFFMTKVSGSVSSSSSNLKECQGNILEREFFAQPVPVSRQHVWDIAGATHKGIIFKFTISDYG